MFRMNNEGNKHIFVFSFCTENFYTEWFVTKEEKWKLKPFLTFFCTMFSILYGLGGLLVLTLNQRLEPSDYVGWSTSQMFTDHGQ